MTLPIPMAEQLREQARADVSHAAYSGDAPTQAAMLAEATDANDPRERLKKCLRRALDYSTGKLDSEIRAPGDNRSVPYEERLGAVRVMLRDAMDLVGEKP
jgi:hypothetical protein